MADDTSANNTVVPPKVLESKPPTYTAKAMRERIEGTVTLEASVDTEAKVKVLRVVKGLDPALDDKAKQAVLGWKFAPATQNGVPVDAVTLIDVDFKIPPQVNLSLRSAEGGPVKIVPGVQPPKVLFRVEPEYTPEARDAKVQGTVVVQAVIHEDGGLEVIKIVRGLDYGLTDKAVEALQQWKFTPGMKDGKAVSVALNVEVNFNLK
jgi:TonB family protein